MEQAWAGSLAINQQGEEDWLSRAGRQKREREREEEREHSRTAETRHSLSSGKQSLRGEVGATGEKQQTLETSSLGGVGGLDFSLSSRLAF